MNYYIVVFEFDEHSGGIGEHQQIVDEMGRLEGAAITDSAYLIRTELDMDRIAAQFTPWIDRNEDIAVLSVEPGPFLAIGNQGMLTALTDFMEQAEEDADDEDSEPNTATVFS